MITMTISLNEYIMLMTAASHQRATICIPFVFRRIIAPIILIWPNSNFPLFGTTLVNIVISIHNSNADFLQHLWIEIIVEVLTHTRKVTVEFTTR